MEHTINLKLGRATIGDLFIKNKISQLRDGSTLENIQLKIPNYQRPYKWTARNAIQLLDDIIEARNNNKEVYRVGTLILHREQKPKDDEVFNIVDGQQRSITFSLLLYALYELEKETNRHNIRFLNQQVFDNTYNQHNIPNNLNAFRRRVYKDSKNEENVNFINEMKQKYTTRMIYENCRPRFNHEFALSKLKAEGYKIAVCSNSIRMTIEMMMEYARLDSYLDFIISNQDVEKPKPDPEIYQTAMKQLQLQPDECLICEDNDNGIKAALASNGHLMTIRTVDDVNYDAIKDRIAQIEGV